MTADEFRALGDELARKMDELAQLVGKWMTLTGESAPMSYAAKVPGGDIQIHARRCDSAVDPAFASWPTEFRTNDPRASLDMESDLRAFYVRLAHEWRLNPGHAGKAQALHEWRESRGYWGEVPEETATRAFNGAKPTKARIDWTPVGPIPDKPEQEIGFGPYP